MNSLFDFFTDSIKIAGILIAGLEYLRPQAQQSAGSLFTGNGWKVFGRGLLILLVSLGLLLLMDQLSYQAPAYLAWGLGLGGLLLYFLFNALPNNDVSEWLGVLVVYLIFSGLLALVIDPASLARPLEGITLRGPLAGLLPDFDLASFETSMDYFMGGWLRFGSRALGMGLVLSTELSLVLIFLFLLYAFVFYATKLVTWILTKAYPESSVPLHRQVIWAGISLAILGEFLGYLSDSFHFWVGY